MQGPPVNLVLLGLLILFFGLQLRGRKEQPYRGWLLGWVLIFLSYLDWDVMTLLPSWYRGLELLRVDILVLGIVSFLLSFLLHKTRPKRAVAMTGMVLVPAMLLIDLPILGYVHSVFYVPLSVVGGFVAAIAVHRLVPRPWKRRRGLLYGLCGLTVACIILALRTKPEIYMQEAFLSPVLVAIAILYMASSRSRQTVRALGGIGFLLWAEFYAFSDMLPRPSLMLQTIYQFWDIPKYFVGTAMILELFETQRLSVERMADRYRLLYENLNLLYETHPQPMWVYEVKTRRILSANATAVRIYGYDLDELLRLDTDALEMDAEPQSGDGMTPWPIETASTGLDGRRALHRHKDGEIVTVLVTERYMLYEGKEARVVLAVDVTEQEKRHQELFHRAHHDPLTQLPNRELLADRVAQSLARCERDSKCAVLLTIDVDYFKHINDTYGHPVGDECLKQVASRLQGRIRQIDTLARTGGEEFTAIIGGLSRQEDAELVAESLRHLFDAPLVLEERSLQITVSIGGALFPEDGTTFDALRKHSDEALYRAKRAGRNSCAFHSTRQVPVTKDGAVVAKD